MALRVALIGPGAIGGAIAGALVEAGAAPLLCARTPFDHLTVEHPAGVVAGSVDCRSRPADLDGPDSPAELVILAVKAHQTESAAGWLSALAGPDTTVVVAQNGVEQVERVGPLVPPGAEVVPAVVWCPAERSGPGRIRVTGPANLVLPAGPGGRRLAELLAGSFFGARLSDDFTTRAWDKLLINAALGAAGVLTGRPGVDLAADPAVRHLMLQQMAEIVAVARAEGASVGDDRPAEILDSVVERGGVHLSSIAVDRLAGQPTEWDARNAVIGRLGARHGIATPLNDWLTALIRLGEPGPT